LVALTLAMIGVSNDRLRVVEKYVSAIVHVRELIVAAYVPSQIDVGLVTN
jgi:hypothetical protein